MGSLIIGLRRDKKFVCGCAGVDVQLQMYDTVHRALINRYTHHGEFARGCAAVVTVHRPHGCLCFVTSGFCLSLCMLCLIFSNFPKRFA